MWLMLPGLGNPTRIVITTSTPQNTPSLPSSLSACPRSFLPFYRQHLFTSPSPFTFPSPLITQRLPPQMTSLEITLTNLSELPVVHPVHLALSSSLASTSWSFSLSPWLCRGATVSPWYGGLLRYLKAAGLNPCY